MDDDGARSAWRASNPDGGFPIPVKPRSGETAPFLNQRCRANATFDQLTLSEPVSEKMLVYDIGLLEMRFVNDRSLSTLTAQNPICISCLPCLTCSDAARSSLSLAAC
jgi:hypothetical protein